MTERLEHATATDVRRAAFDGLIDAAFAGKNREYALGNTPQQRFMGVWSDGVPVKELKVTDKP